LKKIYLRLLAVLNWPCRCLIQMKFLCRILILEMTHRWVHYVQRASIRKLRHQSRMGISAWFLIINCKLRAASSFNTAVRFLRIRSFSKNWMRKILKTFKCGTEALPICDMMKYLIVKHA
ncbi:hypothetical protein T07_11497, partial [Trichinella nelsoni]